MKFEMRDIGILRLLFSLIRLVNQQIETIGRGVPCQHALKLLFVESHEFLHSVPESFQKLTGDVTVWHRSARDPK